ncbi:MAG: hypothetical protein AAF196_09500 [Planctomycetota bacterium]
MLEKLSLAATLVVASSLPLEAAAAAAAPQTDKVDLAVLYVGSDGGPRTEDFVRFLGEHFATVGSAVYPRFEASQANDYDVVILDAEMKPTDGSIGIGPQPQLPEDYDRATVLVNGPGVIVADRQFESKIGWY